MFIKLTINNAVVWVNSLNVEKVADRPGGGSVLSMVSGEQIESEFDAFLLVQTMEKTRGRG